MNRMPRGRMLKVFLVIALLFFSLVGLIVALRTSGLVNVQVALLMLVALIGLYVGIGVLVAVYRLVVKLEEAPHQQRSRPPPPKSGND